MKKTITLIIILIYLTTIVYSYQQSSTSYDTLYYYGAGGYAEQTATLDVGTGIGQVTIGEINKAAFDYSIYYGIFYVNTTFTLPLELQFFRINISNFGMEWITFNWT